MTPQPTRRPRLRGVLARSLALTLLISCPLPDGEAGEPMRVKGTSVRLSPPAGFVPAERFPGFQHEESQASIQVTVIPGPVSEARRGMTRAGLQTRGMTLVESSTQTVNGAEALVLNVEQSAEGVPYEKWLVVAGDETATVLLVATTPKALDAPFRAAVRTALLGATWDVSAPTDLYEGLPFRLTPSGTLSRVRRLGANLTLTEPGRPARSARDPIYLVGVSVSPADLTDLAAFSKRRIAQTTGVRQVSNLRARAVQVAGYDAHEIVADAEEADAPGSLLLYQVVVPDGKGYWLVQGIVALERAAEWLPLFRQITASIRRSPDTAEAPGAPVDDDGAGSKPEPRGGK